MSNLFHRLAHQTRETATKVQQSVTAENARHCFVAVLRCIPVMLMTAGMAAAQTGGGNTTGDGTVQGFLNSAVNTFYSQWRFPISALGVIIAIGLYLSDNP